jgi:Tfp pilus assembly protein PilF
MSPFAPIRAPGLPLSWSKTPDDASTGFLEDEAMNLPGLTTPALLGVTIAKYSEDLSRVEGLKPIGVDDILAISLQRENIARTLGGCELETPLIRTLQGADRRYRKLAETGRLCEADEAIGKFRATLQPRPSAWWWTTDEIAVEADTRKSWFLTLLAALLFGVAVSLSADVAGRFLKDGPDFYGAFGILLQAFVALITGATFTEAGRRSLDRLLERISIRRKYRAGARAGIALIALGLAALMYVSLPLLARLYNDAGVEHSTRGAMSRAIDSLRRAVVVDPDFAVAHYNLGDAYEKTFQTDRAITEYRGAMLLDPKLGRAQNNLARLLLFEGTKISAALEMLDAIVKEAERLGTAAPPDFSYAAYKNRGWAHLLLKDTAAAEDDLNRALKFNSESASAYCLLAKSKSDQASRPEGSGLAKDYWQKCLAFAPGDPSLPAVWLSEARRALRS